MIKVHVGRSHRYIPGWEFLCLYSHKDPMSYKDESVDYVFYDHSLEHVIYDMSVYSLSESYRCLRSGGRVRLATLNLDFVGQLYGPDCLRLLDENYRIKAIVGGTQRKSDVINRIHRAHTFIWDLPTITQVLSQIGYKKVIQCCGSRSMDENLQFLEEKVGSGTLIVEAVK